MKVCPQCSSVFGDDFVYCSNDGAVLNAENLSLPSDDDVEAETVIRRDPIIVDFNSPAAPPLAETVEMNYGSLPPVPTAQPVVVEKTSNSKFYALFLLIGLLLGGGLVLATLLAARFINRPAETNIAVQTRNEKSETSKTPIVSERDNEVDQVADALHRTRAADKPDEDFNGRVIVENANVRAAPNVDSNQADILPVGDRLSIERRQSASSPWYYVTCEHGISGWMHGNTIEFTRDNF